MSFCRRTVLALFCNLFLAAAAFSLQQNPEQETVFRVSVDLVQVDAVVTNSKDEPVTDLKAEDFVILQDGVPQNITHFSYVRTTDAAAPVRKAPAVKADGKPIPPPPPVPMKRDKVRRTIAMIVDDLGLSGVYVYRTREWIKKWIDQDMQPDDLIAVIRTGGGVGALHQFTNDRRILYASTDLISYNPASRVSFSDSDPSSPAVEKDIRGIARPIVAEERDLLFTKYTVSSIQNVVDALKDLPGRKSIILISENFKLLFNACAGQSQGRDLVMKDTVQHLIDSANRSAVVIHSIDPRGLIAGADTCALLASQDGLSVLAQRTGGLFVSNHNDILKAIKTVAADGDGYYLIGYPPDEKTVGEMKKNKSKLHKIEVRVKRPGLRVRSRTEFLSVPDKKTQVDLLTRQERVGQALQSPFSGGDLRVRLTALFWQAKDEKPSISALLHFDADKLSFSEEPDGWHNAAIEITAALFGSDGQEVDFADKTWNLQAKGKTYDYMTKYGISFLMNVPVKGPGVYQMRLVLRDTATGKLGSATQVIEVPNVRDGKLALSGIIMAADKSKSEAAADRPEGMIEEDSRKTAAVRIFESGETVAWAYQVLNARTEKSEKPQVQVQVRLYCDGKGVYEGAPVIIESPQKGSKRMIAADQLYLKQLPPGYYVLQIAVTDLQGKEKKPSVQTIDFDARTPEKPKERETGNP
jgi:VWFA-related protein